jgi:hypothetical protein
MIARGSAEDRAADAEDFVFIKGKTREASKRIRPSASNPRARQPAFSRAALAPMLLR